MAAVFQVYENEKIFVEQIVGTGAIGYFARFASGNDRISNIAKELTDTEAALNHDVLYAEIIHLPEERSLNVMAHPQFWQYEIQYFDDAKGSNVINLQDIDVFVDRDRVVLYSKVHKKEIIPRLSSAYNYNRSEHPVFTLLCDLQCQSPVNNLVFDWGKLSMRQSFLPRLETNDGIILFRATWTFNSKELLGAFSKDEKLWKNYFSDFKTKWKIPSEFFVVRGDNELIINIDNEIAMSVFYKEIKNAQCNIVLKECLHSQYQTIITDVENSRYTHQFIAPFINSESSLIRTSKVLPFTLEFEKKTIPRQFVPGSEWLYLKIFVKPDLSNSILLQLYKLLDKSDVRNLVKQWFYVRYLEGGYHIRFRIQLRYVADFQKLLIMIQQLMHPYVESGEISKIQIDTYVREIERYEPNGILLAERLFAFDSIYCCKSCQITEGSPVEHSDLLAFWLMTKYIGILDPSKVVQLIFAEKCFEAFSNEFDCKALKIHVDKLYRTYSKPLSDIKDEYSKLITLFTDQLNQIVDPKSAPVAESFLASIIHMFVNRYYIVNQRLHECLLYGLVIKALKAEIARNRQKTN
jgi:thiopeptide-type bacteriocin biosynthesis protein